MNFKPISSKIKKCYLGITLESEFVKEGNAKSVVVVVSFYIINVVFLFQ